MRPIHVFLQNDPEVESIDKEDGMGKRQAASWQDPNKETKNSSSCLFLPSRNSSSFH